MTLSDPQCAYQPLFFFFSSRRRHTRSLRDWSSDVCSPDLVAPRAAKRRQEFWLLNQKPIWFSTLVAPEDVFADRAVDAPISVDDLGNAEIGAHRHQRDRLIFAQAMHGHQEPAQLPESIPHRAVEAGMVCNLRLRIAAELGEIVRIGEAIDRPGMVGFQH